MREGMWHGVLGAMHATHPLVIPVVRLCSSLWVFLLLPKCKIWELQSICREGEEDSEPYHQAFTLLLLLGLGVMLLALLWDFPVEGCG